jgi:hypothetical protein
MITITAANSSAQSPPSTQAKVAISPLSAHATLPTQLEAVVTSEGNASSAITRSPDSAAEQKIASLIGSVRDHNDIADALSHLDWKVVVQTIGAEKAATIKAQMYKYIDYSTARISVEFAGSGVAIQSPTDQQTKDKAIAPGSLLIGSFSFQLGGSTYAMTPDKDGNLVGTKDGQAWKTWQVVPPSTWVHTPAETALATLQDLVANAKARNGTEPASLVDVVA